MHLYSIVETVLYVFYEAILNKSVYSLHRVDCMDGKRDLHIQKGLHPVVHNVHPMEQKGDTFPLPET